MAIAHTPNWAGQHHDLVLHLRAVAELAADFGAAFGARDAAYLLGLWHDIGKFHPVFQAYLRACAAYPGQRGRGPDHKGAGAWLAQQHLGLGALVVQAHHGGLRAPTDFQIWLNERAKDDALGQALALARAAIPDLEPTAPVHLPPHADRDPVAAELLLRMLLSALVDADRLDTEAHFQPERALGRRTAVTLAELWERFARDQQRITGQHGDTVNRVRHAVYEACLAAAEKPPGLFRLAVPTGGGKTRSAMAFALRHALRHDLRRVVVAVPFISITEQTAEVYRGIFESYGDGQPVVLEHHSAVEQREDDEDGFLPARVWTRQAAENWDAPIVVTTTVQLFESLFADGASRCRKLHRLARSVIILDEAQALPAHLLTPILDVVRQLCEHYGATVVLSTATPPAFETIPVFRSLPTTEIVPDAERHFAALERVRYEWYTDRTLTWDEVADHAREERQALAVLNTKRDALALLDALDDPGALHLSTLLCGAHRREVIATERRRLAAGERCLLISTQVVEAGVDLDFPLVLRALGPLDAIIQAAGRCNREGRLDRGRVVVFRPADAGLPPGAYRTATDVTRALLGRGDLDLDRADVPREYFRQLFAVVQTDRENVQACRARLDYPEVARRFRMIEPTVSVVVTDYGSDEERAQVREMLDRLRRGTPHARALLRRLQPYLVGIRAHEAARYERQGLITPVLAGLGEWHGGYDRTRGLHVDPAVAEVFIG
jgi:CRISPR-associated endonuclease/helicase Cas3